jgi:hypothetical protein
LQKPEKERGHHDVSDENAEILVRVVQVKKLDLGIRKDSSSIAKPQQTPSNRSTGVHLT